MNIASAPVSFGIFELTADDAGLPDPIAVLDAISNPGYTGTELGPRSGRRGFALADWQQARQQSETWLTRFLT